MRAKFKSFREFKSLLGYGLLALMIAALGTGIGKTLPADAQTGVLDHVTVSPDSTTLLPSAAQQFTAQAFDAANNPITGIGFVWNVAAGGGSINQSGLFTAANTAGTFTNTVQAFAVQGSVIKVGTATVVVTAPAPGPLDHVTVLPATVTLPFGGTQQFTAQAYDTVNNPITGIGFVWNVVAGGGGISQSGFFTAGSTAGTFTNTVQAVAVQGSILKSGAASVTVTATVPIPSPGDLNAKKLVLLMAYSLRAIGFDNFMGAQWSVRENGQISQVTVIPGIVKAISATSLSLLPNGKTETQVFSLTGGSSILAGNKGNKGLKVDEKAIVVTVNGTATLVVPVPIRGVSDLPKELKKDDNGSKGKGPLKQMLGKVRKGAHRGDDKDD